MNITHELQQPRLCGHIYLKKKAVYWTSEKQDWNSLYSNWYLFQIIHDTESPLYWNFICISKKSKIFWMKKIFKKKYIWFNWIMEYFNYFFCACIFILSVYFIVISFIIFNSYKLYIHIPPFIYHYWTFTLL